MSKRYLLSYRHRGAEYNLLLHADSFEDARERVKSLAWARVEGEHFVSIPAHSGWMAALFVWIANLGRWRP